MKTMTTLKTLAVIAVTALATGCVTTKPVVLKNGFDALGAADTLRGGSATIQGGAFMRQQGGGVVTCAGTEVILIPVNEYSTERISYVYGADPQLGETRRPVSRVVFKNTPESFAKATARTKCDAQGNFEFTGLKQASFYVVATASWTVGHSRQGGEMLTKINTSDNNVKKIVISN